MSENQEKTDSNANGAGPDTAKLQAELDKAKSDYLYLLAEFDNYRKNAIKERSDLTKYGSERFLREFLNVFDDFERALETEFTPENAQSFRDGVKMIAGELRQLLQRSGVEELKAQGEQFDPFKHEALGSEPRQDVPAGHVATVLKKGYKLHDKLIRPAQVTVATAPEVKN